MSARTHDGDRVVGGGTLGGMGGNWLDRGHGDGESLVQVSGVPSRDMVASEDRGATGWNSRSTKVVVAALAAAALIGSAGTAYAIRETLFPSLGSPTSPSVWQTTKPPDTTVPPVASSTTSTVPATTIPADTVPVSVPETVTTVEDHGTVDDGRGSGSDSGSTTSGRHGSLPNTVGPKIDDSRSGGHANTTEPASHTGSTVPESGSGAVTTTASSAPGGSSSGSGSGATATTEAPGSSGSGSGSSGSGSSGSGSSGGSDDSGSRHSGTDDRSKPDD